MPILYQRYVCREDLESNQQVLYLFGDNAERRGLAGQAGAMRGEPNAVGIRTKLAPNNRDEAFFSEDPDAVAEQNAWIAEDLEPVFRHLDEGGIAVVPLDGLGTGLARMAEVSPSSWRFLCERIDQLRRY